MDLTGTMASPTTPIYVSDSEDDIDIIEVIPDDTVVIDDTDSDIEEIMDLDGQDEEMEEVAHAIGPEAVLVGLPSGELMIAAPPLTSVSLEDEPTMDLAADDSGSSSDTCVPTGELHEAGLHRYATDDDESVTVPPAAVPETDGPSHPAEVRNTFEAGGPSHLPPSAAPSADSIPPASPTMVRRLDLLASHVDH